MAGLVNPPLSPGMRSLWSAARGRQVHADRLRAGRRPGVSTWPTSTRPGAGQRPLATGVAPGRGPGPDARADRRGRGRHRQAGPPPGAPAGAPPPIPALARAPGPARCWRLLVTAALANAAISATEVALTAYVRHHHALWAAGALAEVSIGSILGSLLLCARVPGAGAGTAGPAAGPAGRPVTPAGWPCSPRPGCTLRFSRSPRRWPGGSWGRRWPPCSAKRPPRHHAVAVSRPRPGSTRP